MFQKVKPYAAMVFQQFSFAVMSIIFLAIVKDGMSQSVLFVYRNAVAAIFIAPFALYFERVEKLNIHQVTGKAKVIGALLTLTGTLLLVLYEGPVEEFPWSKGPERYNTTENSNGNGSLRRIKGTLMILASSTSWSIFLILQGVVCTGITNYLLEMVLKDKGPVFAGAFSPFCMIITAIMGSFILAEKIHLGTILGAIVIVTGLYSLLWGKRKDQTIQSGDDQSKDYFMKSELSVVESGLVEQHSITIDHGTKEEKPSTLP
ncbi:WAT1-related protein At5g07050-like [Dendrobium catenatum]|uniref:WAT1-related protein At5g07050-like n=1 Tax=Dendrobium catenatum TaxID=906689 RepID=UPI0009F6CB50|nr:WAT1-related protein At5g07050-like [Dendrobium catenatum]